MSSQQKMASGENEIEKKERMQTGRFSVMVLQPKKNPVRDDADRIRLGKMLERLMQD